MQRSAKGVPESVQTAVTIIGLPLMLVHGLSFIIGSGTLGLMAWQRFSRSAAKNSVLEPLGLPLLSLILVGVQALPFIVVPAGTTIRPLSWAAYVVAAALALAALSIARTFSALKRGGNKAVCIAALVLTLAIVVVPSLSLKAVASIKGFRLADQEALPPSG
jgi:hypothetical protein